MVAANQRNFDRVRTLRKQVTDRLFMQLLPVTDPEEFADVLDQELVKNWKRNILKIPKRTGWLRDILTATSGGRDRIVRIRSGAVEIDIRHPGALYVSSVLDKVTSAADVSGALKDAMNEIRRRNSARSLARGRRRRY